MKRFVSLLLVFVLLALVIVAPASAASKPQVEGPLKTVRVFVQRMGCAVLYPSPSGCYPLNEAYWQWRPVPPPGYEQPFLTGMPTNVDGWGWATFYPDVNWQGWVQCKNNMTITSVYVNVNSISVTCPTLYTQN